MESNTHELCDFKSIIDRLVRENSDLFFLSQLEKVSGIKGELIKGVCCGDELIPYICFLFILDEDGNKLVYSREFRVIEDSIISKSPLFNLPTIKSWGDMLPVFEAYVAWHYSFADPSNG